MSERVAGDEGLRVAFQDLADTAAMQGGDAEIWSASRETAAPVPVARSGRVCYAGALAAGPLAAVSLGTWNPTRSCRKLPPGRRVLWQVEAKLPGAGRCAATRS